MKHDPLSSTQSLLKKPSIDQSFLGANQKKVLAQITEGIQQSKSLLCLTGNYGVGKSLLVDRYISRLDLKKNKIIRLKHSDVNYQDLFDDIAEAAGVHVAVDDSLKDKGKSLMTQLTSLLEPRVLLIIDQAENMKPATISALINWLKTIPSENDAKHICVFLIGSQTLLKDLPEASVTQLPEQDVCYIILDTLDKSEIYDYIDEYLKRKGEVANLFEVSAMQQIATYSQCIPSQINKLCDLSLLTAKMDGNTTIGEQIVNEVAENCMLLAGQASNEQPVQSNSDNEIVHQKAQADIHREAELHARQTAVTESRKSFAWATFFTGYLLGIITAALIILSLIFFDVLTFSV